MLMGMAIWEVYLNLVFVNDKMLGPTIDPSGLQCPPGSSLCWSITWIKVL